MRPVSSVLVLELFGTFDRELLGTSACERPDSGTLEEAMLRADSGFVRALTGTPLLSCLAEPILLELLDLRID